ncbi:MAG: amidohydrolase, partial [Armatimonadota bacterium]
MGGDTVDVLVRDGRIERMEPAITVAGAPTKVLDGQNQLMLPGLVNAHAHIDKNLLGLPWHKNQVLGSRIRDFVDNERGVRRELNLSTRTQSARQVRAAIVTGTTHLRSHVDIDTDAGLTHFEGVMATREEFRDAITMQLVAFPQSGMLVRPGTVELLEEALRMGADCIGGLDPSTVDRDPVRHLDIVFGLADRYGVEVDIHLHEPDALGAFAVELIGERTRALGMQGRVTNSHVFCLGMIEDAYLGQLIDLLLENRITIMSLGSGRSQFPPLKRLYDAGVRLCTGTDGVRDTWGPYNSVDMLDRVRMLGYRSGYRKDEDIEMLLRIAT